MWENNKKTCIVEEEAKYNVWFDFMGITKDEVDELEKLLIEFIKDKPYRMYIGDFADH